MGVNAAVLLQLLLVIQTRQESRSNDFLGGVSNLATVSSGFSSHDTYLPSVQCLSRIEPIVRKLFRVFEFCSFSCLEQAREGPLLWIYNDIFRVVGIQCLHRTENTPCLQWYFQESRYIQSNIAFHLFRIPQHVSVQWGIIRLAKMEE